MSSTSSLRHPPPHSSWERVPGEGEQEEGAGHSHTLFHGASGSAARLLACPGHESSMSGSNHHPGHQGKLA